MHLRSRGLKDSLQYIDEIEAFARQNKTATKRRLFDDSSSSSPPKPTPTQSMAGAGGGGNEIPIVEEERHALVGDYVTPHGGTRNQSPIVLSPEALRVNIQAQWLPFISSTQFSGNTHEDPHAFLDTFYDNLRAVGITDENLDHACMRLFHIVLIGAAKTWFKACPPRSFTTWDQVESAFLTRFFPPTQIINTKAEISAFKQGSDEEYFEAWDRFQLLLRKCPNHGYDDLTLVNTFYNGLKQQWKINLDCTAGGSIENMRVDNALKVMERMATTDRAGFQPRTQVAKPKGVLELSASDALLAQSMAQSKLMTDQFKALNENIVKLVSPQVQQVNAVAPSNVVCELCNGNHPYDQCSFVQEEQVQFVNNNNRSGNFSSQPFRTNNFSNANAGWKNNQGEWSQGSSSSSKSSLATLMEKTSSLADNFNEFIKISLDKEEKYEVFKKSTEEFQRNAQVSIQTTQASIRNLEVQVGQISKQLADMNKTPFSAHTQVHSNEECKSIVTRSGVEINKELGDNLRKEKEDVIVEILEEDGVENEGEKSEEESVRRKEKEEEKKIEKEKKKEKESEIVKKNVEKPQLVDLPYPPNQSSKKDKERQRARFLDIFQRLQINIPFMEAMEQMPTYARFMKELLTKKKRFSEETIQLEAGCSAILSKNLPIKSQDPGSFTIPVDIGAVSVGKALMDLGASINLIPLSMLKRIGDIDIKPTRMTLQLADRSMKYPYGIAEDVLVKVGKFLFPVDFVVMDIEEDKDVPIILGRPFMKTARVLIDCDKGNLKVRVDDEEVTFDVFKAMKHPMEKQEVYRIDVGEDIFDTGQVPIHNGDMLERALVDPQGDYLGEDQEQLNECLHRLDAYKEFVPPRAKFKPPNPEDKIGEPKVEVKVLPLHLNYTFLDDKGKKPVVRSNALTSLKEEKPLNASRARNDMKLDHDKKQKRVFHPGDIVLHKDSKWMCLLGKFKSRWSGPYLVKEVMAHDEIKIENPKSGQTWCVKKNRLKHYIGGDVERLNHHHLPP